MTPPLSQVQIYMDLLSESLEWTKNKCLAIEHSSDLVVIKVVTRYRAFLFAESDQDLKWNAVQ